MIPRWQQMMGWQPLVKLLTELPAKIVLQRLQHGDTLQTFH
ncbi:Uncharacterised protein [Vibrio cholerae]|nr:Uncharacterised protein [Vibrio cholerae]CSI42632.1 Uncharacterised protein [Vibrio cholerae]